MVSDNEGPAILASYWVPFAIAALTLIARMVSRIRFLNHVGPDDWSIMFTMFTATMSSILMTVAVHEGLGRHAKTLTPAQTLDATTYSWIAQAFCIATFTIGKISISLFLLFRVVGTVRRPWHKIYLYSIIISLILINAVVIVLVFTQCKPVHKLFNPASPGHCWNPQITTIYAQFAGAWSALTDLGLVFFAVWVVGHLKMDWKNKFRLCCLLGLGVFAAGCAAAKTYYLSEHDKGDPNDFTYGQTNLLMWTALEQYVIIIGANVPCVQPVFAAFFHKVITTESNGRMTHYPLDDVSVHRSRSLDASTNPILADRGGRGMYGENYVVCDADLKDQPVFMDSAPGIVKTADMDVRYGKDTPDSRDRSHMV